MFIAAVISNSSKSNSRSDSDSSEVLNIRPIITRPITDNAWTESFKRVVAKLRKECANKDRGQAINTQCLDYVTVKTQRKYAGYPGMYLFMCAHNCCGFYDPKDCTARDIGCCHKNFDF